MFGVEPQFNILQLNLFIITYSHTLPSIWIFMCLNELFLCTIALTFLSHSSNILQVASNLKNALLEPG